MVVPGAPRRTRGPGAETPGLTPARSRLRHGGIPADARPRIERESVDVISLLFEPTDGRRSRRRSPGQFIVLRLRAGARRAAALLRSYSLSGPPHAGHYRVSVKHRAERGGRRLSARADAGGRHARCERAARQLHPAAGRRTGGPRQRGHRRDAGAGDAARAGGDASRDGRSGGCTAPASGRSIPSPRGARLLAALAHGRSHIAYSRPDPGRSTRRRTSTRPDVWRRSASSSWESARSRLLPVRSAGIHARLHAGLTTLGRPRTRDSFGDLRSGGESLTPGVIATPPSRRTRPPAPPAPGLLVSFAGSGSTVRWDPSAYQSLLELAEACDVPVRWSCRTGVCHNCESGICRRAVAYQPDPLDARPRATSSSAAPGPRRMCLDL